MEQTFQLKEFGNLSLFEQNQMSSEDRRWYLKRIEEHREAERKAQSKAHQGGGHHGKVNIRGGG